MNNSVALETLLFEAFPQCVVEGTLAPHDCEECNALKEQLTGATWSQVPADFIRANDDVLPLLSPEAYSAFLPAWLRLSVQEPDGPSAAMLLVNLQSADTSRFTSRQATAIVEVAQYITVHSAFGPADPVNTESLARSRLAWSQVAA